ncbi:hypothetical protein [Nocardia harenae]|uniref:hypothetical protein n=1 Tax=Nocardia harenae TaxID=358707 RepID=UPI0012EEDA53|nr:hypothetical protein [Nocardia harenae]
MNPELPQSQPAHRPPPFQARSDRDVLTPNQRTVFFAAYLFLGVGLLIAAIVTAYLSWNSDLRVWAATDARSPRDSPSLLDYLVGAVGFFAAAALPLFLVIAVLKERLRKYMMESPFRR